MTSQYISAITNIHPHLLLISHCYHPHISSQYNNLKSPSAPTSAPIYPETSIKSPNHQPLTQSNLRPPPEHISDLRPLASAPHGKCRCTANPDESPYIMDRSYFIPFNPKLRCGFYCRVSTFGFPFFTADVARVTCATCSEIPERLKWLVRGGSGSLITG